MDANKHIYFHYTPLGKNVTIENTANGNSATLQADGRVERSICDQVVLEGGKAADFQESLDTVSIRGLLHRLKQEDPESLNDRVYLSKICKETLGQGWAGRTRLSSGNSVFQSEGQLLRLFGSEDNKQLSLLTMREDSENRYWAHLINGRLDADYNLIQATVQEQAKLNFPR